MNSEGSVFWVQAGVAAIRRLVDGNLRRSIATEKH
jgi:hypothetical protein